MKSGEKNNAMRYSTLAHNPVLAGTRGSCLDSIVLSLFGVIMHSIGTFRDCFFILDIDFSPVPKGNLQVLIFCRYHGPISGKCAQHSKQDHSGLPVVNQSSAAQTLCWVGGWLRPGAHIRKEESLQGCPISAEKCSTVSVSAGKCAPEEACHQSSLQLWAFSKPFLCLAAGKGKGGRNDTGQTIPTMTTGCCGTDCIKA